MIKLIKTMEIHFKCIAKSKSVFFTLFLIILNSSFVSAQNYNSTNNLGNTGFSIESQNTTKVEINYLLGEFTLTTIEIDGEIFQNINLPGYFLPNNAGAPNLPGSGRYIALPQQATASLKILSYQSDTLFNVNIAPSFRIPKDNEKSPLDYTKNESIYSRDMFFPEKPFLVSDKDVIRGIDVLMLGITPFQYNPVKKQLIVYRDIKIEISFNGGINNFGENRLRSRWWDPLLSDILLNYESLPKMDYNKSHHTMDETGCEYLIITPNATEFQIWADSIKDFRTTQGILTKVVKLSEIGGNTPALIEAYINNAYNTWDIVPAACLLLGDYGTDASNRIIAPLWENYCVSDNIYADVNGNDLPDIILARITARDETELGVMISKFIRYESNPPVDEDFYMHPITSLGWQTNSWFQLCSEVIGGFWREAQGKEPVRINEIYSGTPGSVWSTAAYTEALVNYFGPNGLAYIPEQPSELGGWTGGNAEIINTAIDSGAFMVQHRDHGFEGGWGQPSYTKTNINSLLNTDLTFVWSVNCLTGKFNYGSEVFAEKLHRYTHKDENSGCFGINAATEITYSFVSDVYIWGAYDNMWPDFMPGFGSIPEPRGVLPAFACAAGKYFLEQSAWPYNTKNKVATYHLFHHHGDAFTTVYSEVPQDLTVSHNSILYMAEITFDVTADVDALIAISVNGELIGTGTGTGVPVSINIQPQTPPDQIKVTVTKQNYFRYEAYAEVLPATGAYVVYNNIEINDESGNGNGIMETSESIQAAITVKNVGVEDAENIVVTIASTDPYINITDDSEIYGNITAGNVAVVPNAFSWEIADNIPDMHPVVFELSASDGTLIWISYFSLTGHAPSLETGTILIDDYIGNCNGRLDPGETAFLIIPTFNNGSYNAANTIGSLSCSNEYVTLNNTSFNFYDIGAGLSEEGMFEVSISDQAQAGEYIELMYEVTSGGYSVQQIYASIISPVVEDWETGDMSHFDWETGGDSDWEIFSNGAFEGSFCIKSGTLDHDQYNYLSLPIEVFVEDSISFWCKVSSETGYDFLKFYIDDEEMSTWSGEVDWERSSFLLSEGAHTIKWEYIKDENTTSGDDCGWIDFIVFPVYNFQASFFSNETDICEGETVSFSDQSSGNVESWEWLFEGGTPETSTQQNPTVEYSNAGVFDVSLTITNSISSNTMIMEEYITVSVLPEVTLEPFEMVCLNSSAFQLSGGMPEGGEYSGSGIENGWFYPATAGLGTHTITYAYTDPNGCENFEEENIVVDPCPGINETTSGTGITIYPNPTSGHFTIKFDKNMGKAEIEVVNTLNKIIYAESIKTSSQNTLNINFSNQARGIYFVKIKTNNMVDMLKVIIK